MATIKSAITRRDFMNGVAVAITASAVGAAPAGAVSPPHPYPPSITGLRGAHAGSFETAHAVAWEGKHWARPEALTDSLYDLVIIGAGLSGLAAAHLYREQAGPQARILILDNHDDFGGHAKRNEFDVDGKKIIGYGGSQSIDGPSIFSPGSKAILASLGVDVARFYDYFDQEFYAKRGMRGALFLDQKTYGADALSDLPFSFWSEAPKSSVVKRALKTLPLKDETKDAFRKLVLDESDFLADMPIDQKIGLLRTISYEDYLRRYAGAPEEFILLLRKTHLGLWGCGWDVLSALEATRWEMPGTTALGVADAIDNAHDFEEPYIFHFPDGNATLARLLVRKLLPDAAPGSTMEDMIDAQINYSALDHEASATRIRLNATAVDMRHSPTGKSVDVVYVKEGRAHRVRGRHVVMAGYLAMAPYICAEMPDPQKEAVRFFTKIPLVYGNVALRNWRAFEKAGYSRFYAPSAFYETMSLDFPVSIGAYEFSASPDEPILLHVQHVPIAPGEGLNEKDQHREGRRRLYAMAFDDFESALVDQLTAMLGPHGFDAERDIAGITINRWPHGYAYEYNELFDDPDWSPENGPHLKARERLNRISFANSDSSAYAYVNGAFDAAIRAVDEQISVPD